MAAASSLSLAKQKLIFVSLACTTTRGCIQSDTREALEANRAKLVLLLRPQDRHYITEHWRQHEKSVVYYYTLIYPNLGTTSSQRGESYHPVIRQI